jgi:hypothetical protein
MAFRFFQDENKTRVWPAGSPLLAGRNNLDPGGPIEKGFGLPWTVDPRLTWLDYNCWIECYLDSGLAVHRPLPQSDDPVDTLASQSVSPVDADAPSAKTGLVLQSKAHFRDVVQRMAASRYRFGLKGYALRAGYQIPVPGLKTVGGVPAVLEEEAVAYNRIVGNLSGIPLWYAAWTLWYTVVVPPTKEQAPPPNFAMAISGDQKLPKFIQAPFSTGDSNSVPALPTGDLIGVLRGAK